MRLKPAKLGLECYVVENGEPIGCKILIIGTDQFKTIDTIRALEDALLRIFNNIFPRTTVIKKKDEKHTICMQNKQRTYRFYIFSQYKQLRTLAICPYAECLVSYRGQRRKQLEFRMAK